MLSSERELYEISTDDQSTEDRNVFKQVKSARWKLKRLSPPTERSIVGGKQRSISIESNNE